jgi:hypothetical protein
MHLEYFQLYFQTNDFVILLYFILEQNLKSSILHCFLSHKLKCKNDRIKMVFDKIFIQIKFVDYRFFSYHHLVKNSIIIVYNILQIFKMTR